MSAVGDTLTTLRVDEAAPGVLVATLDRPDRLNAMTDAMFDELEALAGALHAGDTRVLVLTGAGRAFCAGFDLEDADELASLTPLGMLAKQERAARALAAIRALPFPVIAAVNGAAAGGGLALALAADIRLATPAARFNAAFVRIGLSAGDLGTSWLLPRLVGPARAAEVAFTAGFIEADEAERSGLVNRVVAPEALLDEALAMAALIVENSHDGVRLSKRALQASMESPSFAAALEMENRGQALLTRGPDFAERVGRRG